MILMLILVLVLLCAFVFNKNVMIKSKNIEGYDDIHSNLNINDCANLCKTTEGCFGFGHHLNKCYLSNSVIVNYPIHSIYKDFNISDHVVCNKTIVVLTADNNLSEFERKGNAIFICKYPDSVSQQLRYHNKNKFIKLDEGQNFDFMTNVEDYEVGPYRWPESLYEAEQRDTLNQYIG